MSPRSTPEASQTTRMAPLLTAPEVAELLRVTPRTIRRWALEGRIERIKIGRAARFSSAAVAALISGAPRDGGRPAALETAEQDAGPNDHGPAANGAVGKVGDAGARPQQ